MNIYSIVEAVVLGVVEGLTEFIPVSSTGHLVLAGHYLNFEANKSFDVLIQLGAILALLSIYAEKLWRIAVALPKDKEAQRFVTGVLIAFLPAALFGFALHGFIKSYLLGSSAVPIVCYALIAGGFVLLAVDDMPVQKKFANAYVLDWKTCLKIGLFQCLSLIPGVSRSGATIVGAMVVGVDKRAAAEFSFFLAMPTMLGAFVLDLAKSYNEISMDDAGLIAIGFVTAFISGYIVVKKLLDFVSQRGLAIFGWWRIAVGVVGLIAWYTIG